MKLGNIRKSLGLLLSLVMLLGLVTAVPLNASATTLTFEEYLVAQLEEFPTSGIDVLAYSNIKTDGYSSLDAAKRAAKSEIDRLGEEALDIIINNPIKLFHVSTSVYSNANSYGNAKSGSITSMTLTFEYAMTKAQYTANRKKFDDAVNKAFEYAKYAQSDFETAWFLHDYLVLNAEYDTESFNRLVRTGKPLRPAAHTSYGALVTGLAVCQGYALAYKGLLDLAGIENVIVKGRADNTEHMWNQVKIGGNWYHVDVTWDDPINNNTGIYGGVSYKYFLVNDTTMRKTHSWSGGNKSTSTAYNNAFFRDVRSSVIKLGASYYWIEADELKSGYNRGVKANRLIEYNIATKKKTTVHSFEAIWYKNGTENVTQGSYSYDKASYANLAEYNGIIYFNTSKEIHSYDPATKKADVVTRPANMGGSGNRYIFGLSVDGRRITYSVKTEYNKTASLTAVNVTAASARSVGLNRTTLSLKARATSQLTATLDPAGSGDYVYWISSDTSIATVNESGRVTGVSKGKATITAYTANGRQRTCAVTVT